jgi:methionine-rich copper-binding protein CopC
MVIMSRRVAQILIFSILLIVFVAAPALAHVELSSSDPSDGATVTAARTSLTVTPSQLCQHPLPGSRM